MVSGLSVGEILSTPSYLAMDRSYHLRKITVYIINRNKQGRGFWASTL